ncbi:MAG: sodium/proton-translocating pyrophosphatase, partial [Fimbriimonadaceae bacterium]
IVGILMVKGSDDIDSDPLKPISGGFKKSALVAAVGTAILAYFMMGGQGAKINSSRLVSGNEIATGLLKTIKEVESEYAIAKGIKPSEVLAKDILDNQRIKDLKLPDQQGQPGQPSAGPKRLLMSLMDAKEEQLGSIPKLEGFKQIKADSKELERFSAMKPATAPGAANEFKTLKEVLSGLKLYQAETNQQGQGLKKTWFLTSDKTALQAQVSQMSGKLIDEKGQDITIYIKEGAIAVGLAIPKRDFLFDYQMMPLSEQIFDMPMEDLKKVQGDIKAQTDEVQKLFTDADKLKGEAQAKAREAANKKSTELEDVRRPIPITLAAGALEQKEVPWFMFAGCIIFGILMAFIIERLTDYYVSLNGKPVREVAGVSSAGPAPMIISGFALACESSVFSVVAIVASLIMPLVLFPASDYGGYILSFYGIALVGLGLLTTTGYILAMDTFGPIS